MPVVVGTVDGLVMAVRRSQPAGPLDRIVISRGSQSMVFVGSAGGQLEEVIVGETVYLFTNYTATSVDIARIDPDGTVATQEAVPLPAEPPEFRAARLERAYASSTAPWPGMPESANDSVSPLTVDQARQALIYAGIVVNTFVCAKATILTAGVAIIPCAGFVLGVVPRLLNASDEDWSRAANAADVVLAFSGCQSGDSFACASFVGGLSEQILSRATGVQLEQAEPRARAFAGIRFGGTWRYRSGVQGYLIVTPIRLEDVARSSTRMCYSVSRAVFIGRTGSEYQYQEETTGFVIRARIEINSDRSVLTIVRVNDNRTFVFDRVNSDIGSLQPRCPQPSIRGAGAPIRFGESTAGAGLLHALES